MSNPLVLVAALALILQTSLAKIIFRSWFSPAVFFSLYWCLAAILPIVAMPRDYVSVSALLFIVLASIALIAGSMVGLTSAKRTSQRNYVEVEMDSWLPVISVVLVLSSALGIVSGLIAMYDVGFGVRDLFSLSSLVVVANWFSVGRYQGWYSPSMLSQLFRVFVYLSPLFAGTMAALTRGKRDRFWIALAFLPALLITIVQTQRGATILATVLFSSAFVALRLATTREVKLRRSNLLLILFLGPAIFLLFSIVALFRAGRSNIADISLLFPKIFSNIFGHLVAFSFWFDHSPSFYRELGLGRFTFAGIYDVLGLTERKLGLFQEFVLLQSGYLTNIYTIFRPLISDFGIAGTFFILFSMGFTATIVYYKVIAGHIRYVPMLCAYYAFVLMGFNTSIWVWNTVILAFVVYAFVLWGSTMKFRMKVNSMRVHSDKAYRHSQPLAVDIYRKG